MGESVNALSKKNRKYADLAADRRQEAGLRFYPNLKYISLIFYYDLWERDAEALQSILEERIHSYFEAFDIHWIQLFSKNKESEKLECAYFALYEIDVFDRVNFAEFVKYNTSLGVFGRLVRKPNTGKILEFPLLNNKYFNN